jgi:pyruvate,water dikinase
MSYRHHYGIRDDETAMCAGCMPMVDAVYGGVIYTASPLDSEDDAIYIYVIGGAPEQVVNGSGDVVTFVVERSMPLGSMRRQPPSGRQTIDPRQVLRLASDALGVERHFGRAQDIEWAMEPRGRVVFLQSRPITERSQKATSHSDGRASDDILLEGGITASRGRSTGPVFVARTPKDTEHFIDGAVLVTAQPLPVWAPLLDRASALVSEQGTAACHLANVAREYRVPAILGLPAAMSELENGALVTIDADLRQIYAGRAEAIRPPGRAQSPHLKRSPVYQTLSAVSRHIVPLRLIDPNDEGFLPERCETLHDITRYCHEMAVKEMFQFGMNSDFPKAAARRLFTDVATQFWIIDLDDGVVEGADDRYFIKLDQIQSIPMMAVWRGMNADVWEGPPPVNARGMMDLVFKSTMDPNLNPDTRSDYSTGNHVMVAKNYCSLQSRFGYHFATLETLVGQRPMENFINFRFGGGGANMTRQQRRARLLEEILIARGFQADRRKDLVNAQKGGFDEQVMCRALEAIGYLLVHTRQLDMAMTDEDSCRRYKDKLERGLRAAGL